MRQIYGFRVPEGLATRCRGVIHDWYDGPVSGVGQDRATGSVYLFQMAAWDVWQNERIYVLRPLPSDALDRLVAIWSVAGEPQWPWWTPVTFPSDAIRERASEDADAVLDAAGDPEYVLLSSDLVGGTGILRALSSAPIRARVREWLRSSASDADGFSHSEVPFSQWRTLFDEI
jgi:hypothetical protein